MMSSFVTGSWLLHHNDDIAVAVVRSVKDKNDACSLLYTPKSISHTSIGIDGTDTSIFSPDEPAGKIIAVASQDESTNLLSVHARLDDLNYFHPNPYSLSLRDDVVACRLCPVELFRHTRISAPGWAVNPASFVTTFGTPLAIKWCRTFLSPSAGPIFSLQSWLPYAFYPGRVD